MSEPTSHDAPPPAPPRNDATVQVDYLDARRRKRELLSQVDAPREDGSRTTPEEVLSAWPANPAADLDVASVLFEDFCRRRDRGEDASLSEYEKRFPEHQDSLADLVRQQDFFRSVGAVSGTAGCVLRLPEVGEELFGFRLRGSLGRGAFARVYLAEQAGLAGRPVVLKVSAIEGTEPQTLAQLQHTNIVPIYSVHEEPAAGVRAVCMPYFGGASLSAVLQRFAKDRQPASGAEFLGALAEASVDGGRWTVDGGQKESSPPTAHRPPPTTVPYAGWDFYRTTAWIVTRLAEALEHAHERGVLHRDVKPSNVLIDRDGQPLLLDFNLAHDLNNEQARATVGGTVAYMAPEHLRALAARDPALGRLVDRRADVYSLGMVLFEMLAGESPFDQSASYAPLPALIEAMALERGRTVPSLRKKRPDVPWGLESIARKCLAPDAARRYQRAEDLAEDLRRFLDDRPLKHAPELSLRERAAKWMRRHPRLTSSGSVGTAAAVLILCTLGALAGVKSHLAQAEDALEVKLAQDRGRDFEVLALKALRLGNTRDDLRGLAPEAPEVIRAALDLYGAAERDDWQEQPAWKHLDPPTRRRLAEDVRELLLLLAWAHTREDKPSPESLHAALALLDRAAAVRDLEPSPALALDRATYLDLLGRSDEAEAARQESARTPPACARDHYLLALAHARGKRFAEAVAAVDRAVALNRRHYWSWCLRGLCHENLGEPTLAVADYSYCLGLAPEAWVHVNRGACLYIMGQREEAVRDCEAALSLEADMPLARWNRGLALLELGRHADALADLVAVKGAVRDEALRALNEGIALEGLGRPEEADAAFAVALRQAWTAPAEVRKVVLCRYGVAVTQRLPRQAADAFAEALELDPEDAYALYGQGAVLVLRGEPGAGLSRFDQAIEARPDFLEARRFRAVVLARQGKGEAALRDVNFCLKKDAAGGMTLYAAACVTALLSRGDEAMARQALDFLRLAFARNYGRDKAGADDDLTSLRGVADFRELLGSK
jgi:serine/threonine protein kinase/Flp pilus assembly protein TadD